MIPAIIHVTCKTKDLPEIYVPFFQRIKAFHPGWQIILYDDQQCRQVILEHFPHLLNFYDSYPQNIQRVDIFRLAILYLMGGFYMDLDMYCINNLNDLRSHSVVLAEEKTISEKECNELELKHRFRIANYMFGSIPNHPFWLAVIDTAIKIHSRSVQKENDVLETTGPGLLTNVYHQFKEALPDITVLHNRDKICLRCRSKHPSCYFGKYAAHYHYGSWRWENNLSVI